MSQDAGNSFEAALRREIMRSELQRMQALAIILGLLLVVTTLGANFVTDIAHRLFNGRISGWMPIAAIGPFFVYEIGAVLLLRWRMAHDLVFPGAARFGNALVETSRPGVMIYLLAGRMEPALVLGFWPPLLYSSSSCSRPCVSISGCRCGPASSPPCSRTRWPTTSSA